MVENDAHERGSGPLIELWSKCLRTNSTIDNNAHTLNTT